MTARSIAVVFVWFIATLQIQRASKLYDTVKSLPESQRLEAIKLEYNTTPREGLSSDEWLRSRKMSYLLAGFLSILFTVIVLSAFALVRAQEYTASLKNLQSATAKQSQIDAAKRLIDDFERIKVLLPPNRIIADCLKERSHEKFFDAYEACESKSKINNTHALQLIGGSISRISLQLPSDKLDVILQEFEKLRYYVYEINNITLVKAYWRSNNCPSSIAFTSDISKIPKDKNGQVKCALSLEDHDSFIDRKSNSEQPPEYKATAKEFIPMSHCSQNQCTFIIPSYKRTKNTIDSYYDKLTEDLYKSMIEKMNYITNKLKESL